MRNEPDYNYYTNIFKGVELSSDVFSRALIKAKAIVSRVTFGRAEHCPDDRICDCICALIEDIHKEESQPYGISSEKVGDLSVTYSVKSHSQIIRDRYGIVRTYLGNTGLLYRGRL